MHASDFKATVTTIGVHENVFEILMVLQKVLPTLVPSIFVVPKKGSVHGPPDVFQAVRVDVVRDYNLLYFSLRVGHGFPSWSQCPCLHERSLILFLLPLRCRSRMTLVISATTLVGCSIDDALAEPGAQLECMLAEPGTTPTAAALQIFFRPHTEISSAASSHCESLQTLMPCILPHMRQAEFIMHVRATY